MLKINKNVLLSLSILGLSSFCITTYGEENNFKSSVSTTVEGIDTLILPAFGEDDLDKENQGTNTKGPLTIDRIPSFIWNAEMKKEGNSSFFDTGSIVNQNAYLQISDTRGTYKGYVVKVLFDGNDKWLYDDNIEVDPSGIELKLETRNDDYLRCTEETKGIAPPKVSTSIMTVNQEIDAVIADEGTGVGTWGIWWKKSHILMDKSIPRADHTIKSRAITWRLVDAPK
ncbi:WxL domain-containing protein [Vagococcus fluvialis]|uniref:WxL domain-containing protein n=1 Tax=Vagococcus fluvialis TaxID=2738 RepID=UPI001A8E3D73|nr:WxL domain-containing protein [Vagococcus fluvialis]MBO0437451.1 WxL domain-containing protein [Vagococcus fluvialis]